MTAVFNLSSKWQHFSTQGSSHRALCSDWTQQRRGYTIFTITFSIHSSTVGQDTLSMKTKNTLYSNCVSKSISILEQSRGKMTDESSTLQTEVLNFEGWIVQLLLFQALNTKRVTAWFISPPNHVNIIMSTKSAEININVLQETEWEDERETHSPLTWSTLVLIFRLRNT